jgi:hypothetical protein
MNTKTDRKVQRAGGLNRLKKGTFSRLPFFFVSENTGVSGMVNLM